MCNHGGCSGLSLWWGRRCHYWYRAAGVDLLITPCEGVFVLLWGLGPVVFWELLLVSHISVCIEVYLWVWCQLILLQLMQGGDEPYLPCIAVRPLRALCWVQERACVQTSLVNKDHAFTLHVGSCFPPTLVGLSTLSLPMFVFTKQTILRFCRLV